MAAATRIGHSGEDQSTCALALDVFTQPRPILDLQWPPELRRRDGVLKDDGAALRSASACVGEQRQGSLPHRRTGISKKPQPALPASSGSLSLSSRARFWS